MHGQCAFAPAPSPPQKTWLRRSTVVGAAGGLPVETHAGELAGRQTCAAAPPVSRARNLVVLSLTLSPHSPLGQFSADMSLKTPESTRNALGLPLCLRRVLVHLAYHDLRLLAVLDLAWRAEVAVLACGAVLAALGLVHEAARPAIRVHLGAHAEYHRGWR